MLWLIGFSSSPFMCFLVCVCTCKDALVLEARQEGQGIYTTCQSLCYQFNLAPQEVRMLCACATEIGWVLSLAERPILNPILTSVPDTRAKMMRHYISFWHFSTCWTIPTGDLMFGRTSLMWWSLLGSIVLIIDSYSPSLQDKKIAFSKIDSLRSIYSGLQWLSHFTGRVTLGLWPFIYSIGAGQTNLFKDTFFSLYKKSGLHNHLQ